MELELDIRYYLDVVLRQWKAVVLVFVVATVAAVVVSFIKEPTYEATVTLLEQTHELYTVPRLGGMDRTVLKLYPALARTEAVESRVIDAIGPSLSVEEKRPGVLMSKVTVREDSDNPMLFRISAQASDQEKAVLIANTWAEQYVGEAKGTQAGWSTQFEAVKQELESAEEELNAFRQEKGPGYGSVQPPEADYTFAVLGMDGVRLQKKMDLLAEHEQALDDLRLLLESARLARDAGGSIDDLPLQLVDTQVISARGHLSVELLQDQETLDGVIELLENEEEVISGVVDQLDAQVGALQEQLALDQLELERLVRARNVASIAYEAIRAELQESEFFQTNTQILSRASRARLLGPAPKLSAILGAALGLAAGVAAAFAVEYVQSSRKKR
jgi:uncharacterized protein involved in exopolysaccharide biosynthesis